LKQEKVKVIFFDLDDTLFDYSASSTHAREEVFTYLLGKYPHLERDELDRRYDSLIDEAKRGESRGSYNAWNRQTRFSNLPRLLGLEDRHGQLSKEMTRIYTEVREKTTRPFPRTIETLKKLMKTYSLGLITNGPSENQRAAIQSLGIQRYFQCILVSEEVGCQKPEPEIFELGLRKSGCNAYEAVMVSNSMSHDILPSKKIGMKAILIDTKRKYDKDEASKSADHIIYDIDELTKIL